MLLENHIKNRYFYILLLLRKYLMARAKNRVDKKRVDIPDIPNYRALDIRPYLLMLVILIITSVTLATFMKQEVRVLKSEIETFTYYVDATNGDDTWDGLYPTYQGGINGPWRTIGRVESQGYFQGDATLFKRGETWREQLDVPASYLTIGSYGTGENPVISAAILIGSWTPSSNPNIWYKTGVTTQPYIVYFDGVRGTPETSTSNLNAEREWYWYNNRLYVWSSSDPNTLYTNPGVEAGTWEAAVKLSNKYYVTIENLTLRYGNSLTSAGLDLDISPYITIKNCVIEKNYGFGIKISGPGNGGNTISNCTIKENGLGGITSSGIPQSSNTIEDNIIQDNGWREASSSGISGTYLTDTIIRRNIISNNGAGDPNDNSNGIDLSYAAGSIEIYENLIKDNSKGYGILTKRSADIYRNLIYRNKDEGIASKEEGTNPVDVNIYHNIIHSNGGGIRNFPSNDLSVRVYNNVLYNNINPINPDATQHEIFTGAIDSLRITNNIIFPEDVNVDPWDHYAYFINGVIPTTFINFNCVYNASSSYVAYLSYDPEGTQETWEEWQSYGLDLNSINSNPMLKNPSNNELYLNTSSPCIGRGRSLGYRLDDALNPDSIWPNNVMTIDQDDYGVGWEIGAYIMPRPTFFAANTLDPISWTDASMNDWLSLTNFMGGFVPSSRVVIGDMINDNNDLSANFSILYDSTYLYVGVRVTDDELIDDNAAPGINNDDSVEFYLDEDNQDCLESDCLDPTDVDNHQYTVDIANLQGGRNYDIPGGINYREFVVTDGYFVEYAIPWSSLSVATPTVWSIMRTDVGVNEDDAISNPDGDDRESQIMWNGDRYNYLNTTLYGLLILSDTVIDSDNYCGDGECTGNEDDCGTQYYCGLDCPPCPECGNDVAEQGEVCDGLDHNEQTCISRGFDGGELYCAIDCLSFDESSCITIDTTPPNITLVNPTQGQSLPAGTTSTSINITTDEIATCKYSTDASLITWDDMILFPFSDTTNHSRTRTGLSNGNTYYEYFLCEDTATPPNTMAETTNLTFSVASPGTPPSDGSGGGGGGGGGSGNGDEIEEDEELTTEQQTIIDVNLFENPEITLTSQVQQLILTVDNVNERLMQITSITDNQITFTLSNEESTLSIGESKVFTLDGANIQITLNSIISGNANLTFKKVDVEAPIIKETWPYLKVLIWVGLIAVATITTLFLVRRKEGEPPFQKARERVEEIRRLGYKDDQIREMFRKKGWPDQAIDKLFRK